MFDLARNDSLLLRWHSPCGRPSLLKRGHHRGPAGLVGQDLVYIVHDGIGQLRKELESAGGQKFRKYLRPSSHLETV